MYSSTASSVRKLDLPALLAVTATTGLAPPTSAAAFAGPLGYSLTGTGSSVPGTGSGCVDCQGPTMNASGTAACRVCIPGKPTSGNFTINLAFANDAAAILLDNFPPNPCLAATSPTTGSLAISGS